MESKFEIERMDVCMDLHSMSDIGYVGDGTRMFSRRTHVADMECYAQIDGRECRRNGKCLVVKFRGSSEVE